MRDHLSGVFNGVRTPRSKLTVNEGNSSRSMVFSTESLPVLDSNAKTFTGFWLYPGPLMV